MPRIKTLENLVYHTQAPHSLTLKDARGAQLDIAFLAQDLVRVCVLPQGTARLDRTWTITDARGVMPREGRPRKDVSRFECPTLDPRETPQGWELHGQALQIQLNPQDARLIWHYHGTPFAADLRGRAYLYDVQGTHIYHYMQRRPDEYYYGFGERSGTLDKRGLRMEMRNLDALGYSARTSDPLYKHFPFYITFIPALNIAYGLFYDNAATSIFDMGCEIDALWGEYRKYEAHDGDIDYYMMVAPTIEGVIERFTDLVGRPFLPPRYTLGYLGSTMSYTDAPNAQAQLKQFAELTRQHQIPCDLFHLSSGYTTDKDGNRCVFTWNRDKIPSPQAMVDGFHAHGIRLAANVKPYLLQCHPAYAQVAQMGGFLADADTPTEPSIGTFWSGGAYENARGAYLDFTSEQGYTWWQTQLKAQLFGYGIDVIWNDNNEFGVWDDAARCDGFGQPFPIGQARPLQTLLMAHASYNATRDYYTDRRPFVLSRSGMPGIQRYAQTWSGDNFTSWETLRYNIPMGLGLSLSGAPNTGHDIGGFHGASPDPELFVRWVQNGVFHPRFTIHSWNTDGTVNEAWMHPEVTHLIRDAIQFRYRLMPYLYSLFVESARTGHPIIRPMVYHFWEDARTHSESFDFMLGAHLLIASVLEQGATIREVYLPMGCAWYDFHTHERFEGGQTVTLDAPLSRFPLVTPSGAIIPMGKLMNHVGELPDDERIVHLFPPEIGRESQFTLYEDDGFSNAYERGEQAQVNFKLSATAEFVDLIIHIDDINYPLPYSAIQLKLPTTETRPLRINGQPATPYQQHWIFSR